MVRLCCICKAHSGANNDVSFHSIPNNEEIKEKWFESIGREVSKSSSVCSKHFKQNDFIYKVYGDSVKRFLTPTAIPLSSVDENSTPVISKSNEDSLTCHVPETTSDKDAQLSTEPQGINCSILGTSENSSFELTDSDNCGLLGISVDENYDYGNLSISDENVSLKRSNDEINVKAKRICNPRYIGDLTREDFTSEVSWNIVQNFVQDSRKKQKSLSQQIRRTKKSMESLKSLLADLKAKGFLSSDLCSSLELSTSPALQKIIENILSKKDKVTYTAELKEFACTLMFYSTSAYNYVRNNFMKCLPHPQTIRRWFTKINMSPGISECVLKKLKLMQEEYAAKNVQLQFGIQVDEMSIKKQIEWDGRQFHGHVDLGLGNDETDEATYALVFMLVALNGHFKTPIAYYFIKGLSSEIRANILLQILETLHEYKIVNIRSLTFDGASTNLSTVKQLGANLTDIDEDCYFEHPVTRAHITIVPDACHMLKLIRNALSQFELVNSNGLFIKWYFLEKLVEIQDEQNLHAGTKIRRRHINFLKEKMKVKLAAQTFSTSVSKALLFMKKKFPEDFYHVDATAEFCQKINDIFDLLNSRSKFAKNESQECIIMDNYKKLKDKADELINYIKGLRLIENGKRISVLNSKRRIGFWGFIVGLKSALKLANFLFTNKYMTYLLTYKLSQDHLETFFSCMRRMGGFNNNPTCRQFRSNYKKLVTHVNSIVPDQANCNKQDDTIILKFNNSTDKQKLSVGEANELYLNLDHDYIGINGWTFNEYCEEIVHYIAGAIVHSIKRKITCDICLEHLQKDSTSSLLIQLKDRPKNKNIGDLKTKKSGLIYPSDDVVTVCKTAEKVIRMTPDLLSKKNILNRLIIHAKSLLISVELFTAHTDMIMEASIFSSHKLTLINLILSSYFKIRLHHEAKVYSSATDRIRSFHNRLVIFKNQ